MKVYQSRIIKSSIMRADRERLKIFWALSRLYESEDERAEEISGTNRRIRLGSILVFSEWNGQEKGMWTNQYLAAGYNGEGIVVVRIEDGDEVFSIWGEVRASMTSQINLRTTFSIDFERETEEIILWAV